MLSCWRPYDTPFAGTGTTGAHGTNNLPVSVPGRLPLTPKKRVVYRVEWCHYDVWEIMVSFYISTWQACSLTRTRRQKRCILRSLLCPKIEFINTFYLYIDTSEIPGELSRENMLSSHMKRSPLLSGYIINRAFHRKSYWSKNGLVFHWCLYHK